METTPNQMDSNLSKTKTAFRTSGGVTGNFGAGKRTAGSALNDIPANSRESLGSFPTDMEYRARMVEAYNKTDDNRLRDFCLAEVKRIDQKHSIGLERAQAAPTGPHCIVGDHFVGAHQM